jgi:hypothetical protein
MTVSSTQQIGGAGRPRKQQHVLNADDVRALVYSDDWKGAARVGIPPRTNAKVEAQHFRMSASYKALKADALKDLRMRLSIRLIKGAFVVTERIKR